MSTRESILAAIATQLASVASGRVYRSRREQLPTLPAVIIEPDAAQSMEIALGAMDHELTVSIAVYAKSDTPDNGADATLLAAHTALIADRSLGLGNGITLLPEFDADWQFEDYDYVRASHKYRITYRTTGNDF
jgi:hypothetical protein